MSSANRSRSGAWLPHKLPDDTRVLNRRGERGEVRQTEGRQSIECLHFIICELAR